MKDDMWSKVETSDKFNVKFKKLNNHDLSTISLDKELSENSLLLSDSDNPDMTNPDFGELKNHEVENAQVVLINTEEYCNGYIQVDEHFRCSLCGYLTDSVLSVCCHLQEQHVNWENTLEEKKRKLGNVNDYPQWKEDLRDNFDEIIISKCSQPTKAAWTSKKSIENREEYIQVRTEILQRTRSHIVQIYGTVSTPNLKVMDYVVNILSRGYPYMFSNEEGGSTKSKSIGTGYGCGGAFGNKYLAKNMRDRIAQRQSALRSEELKAQGACDEDDVSPLTKKGKRAQKYGK